MAVIEFIATPRKLHRTPISTNIDQRKASLAPLESGGPPLSNGAKLVLRRSTFAEMRPGEVFWALQSIL